MKSLNVILPFVLAPMVVHGLTDGKDAYLVSGDNDSMTIFE